MRAVLKIYDDTESPNEGVCLRYMIEPESPSKRARLRYMQNEGAC